MVALEILEEVLAHVHTAKDVTCKEDKVGTGYVMTGLRTLEIVLSLISPTT